MLTHRVRIGWLELESVGRLAKSQVFTLGEVTTTQCPSDARKKRSGEKKGKTKRETENGQKEEERRRGKTKQTNRDKRKRIGRV